MKKILVFCVMILPVCFEVNAQISVSSSDDSGMIIVEDDTKPSEISAETRKLLIEFERIAGASTEHRKELLSTLDRFIYADEFEPLDEEKARKELDLEFYYSEEPERFTVLPGYFTTARINDILRLSEESDNLVKLQKSINELKLGILSAGTYSERNRKRVQELLDDGKINIQTDGKRIFDLGELKGFTVTRPLNVPEVFFDPGELGLVFLDILEKHELRPLPADHTLTPELLLFEAGVIVRQAVLLSSAPLPLSKKISWKEKDESGNSHINSMSNSRAFIENLDFTAPEYTNVEEAVEFVNRVRAYATYRICVRLSKTMFILENMPVEFGIYPIVLSLTDTFGDLNRNMGKLGNTSEGYRRKDRKNLLVSTELEFLDGAAELCLDDGTRGTIREISRNLEISGEYENLKWFHALLYPIDIHDYDSDDDSPSSDPVYELFRDIFEERDYVEEEIDVVDLKLLLLDFQARLEEISSDRDGCRLLCRKREDISLNDIGKLDV